MTLEWNLKFDVRERYQRLRKLYRELGLTEEAAWVDGQLARFATTH